MNKQHFGMPCLAPVRVGGVVTRLENGAILLKSSDENDPYHEVILHLTETTPVVDAVSGLPLDRKLRDGETVCAWVGPAMTLSLPPHAAAEAVVANIPADDSVPRYCQIAKARQQVTASAHSPLSHVNLVTTGGEELTVTNEAVLFPYLTRQIVALDDLAQGSCVLVWRSEDGSVSRVLLFPQGRI